MHYARLFSLHLLYCNLHYHVIFFSVVYFYLQWHDDSIDSQPDTSANPSERLRVPRPKRVNPVTNVPWNKEYSGRRKKKWWTVEEEDALRKAVDKYVFTCCSAKTASRH